MQRNGFSVFDHFGESDPVTFQRFMELHLRIGPWGGGVPTDADPETIGRGSALHLIGTAQ